MNDPELLELAAKAAGIECDEKGPFTSEDRYDLYNGIHTVDLPWNPLKDDGDALRLAVKLNISIMIDMQPEVACVYAQCVELVPDLFCEPLSRDGYAATRRAIVRAAAKIGEAT